MTSKLSVSILARLFDPLDLTLVSSSVDFDEDDEDDESRSLMLNELTRLDDDDDGLADDSDCTAFVATATATGEFGEERFDDDESDELFAIDWDFVDEAGENDDDSPPFD